MATDVNTPAEQKPYDPIQMLSDYLGDNKDTPGYFRNFLINRLGDQIIWYDKKSGFFKRRWEGYRRVVIILSASIPFLVGLLDNNFFTQSDNLNSTLLNQNITIGLKLVIGLAGVIIAVLEGFNALYKSQELYVAYRKTAEKLRHEFSTFLGRVGDYSTPGEGSFSKLVANVETIVTEESSQWAELASKTKRATSESVESWVKDYLARNGYEMPVAKNTGENPTDNSGDPNDAASVPPPGTVDPNTSTSEVDPDVIDPNNPISSFPPDVIDPNDSTTDIPAGRG